MSDPYASHLPTLRFVLGLVKPERVLELGAGDYSTNAFLECPSLKRLLTIETDREWARRFRDERLTMRLAEDAVEALPHDLMAYDLVFIDNGRNANERGPVITSVLSRPHPVTVIHDAEHYREEIISATDRFLIFNNLLPHTAVCW